MNNKSFYIVCTTENMRDVKVVDMFDASVFSLSSIVAGYQKRFNTWNMQVSYLGDNAFIDLIDNNNELINTYSIIKQSGFVSRH